MTAPASTGGRNRAKGPCREAGVPAGKASSIDSSIRRSRRPFSTRSRLPGPSPSFTLPAVGHVVRSAGLLIAATAFTACSPPAALPSEPATPSASAIPETAAACPSASGVAVPDLTDGMAPADAVSAYLEAGGDPTALAASLFDLGWGSPNSTVVWTDIDGDGHFDFAAALTRAPDAQGIAEEGSVYLWRCQDGAYLRAEIAPPRPDFGPPAIHEARDLTADGLPELIVAYSLCGVHTCFAQFAVYQWDGASMIDQFQGTSDDMPSPKLVIEADDPSSPAAIEITATGIGSVGAGPYRTWSRTWTWDGDARAFVPGEPVIEAPRFRIHAIHDADDAYLRGDLEAAVELYQRAIDDDALLDWPAAGARRQEGARAALGRARVPGGGSATGGERPCQLI